MWWKCKYKPQADGEGDIRISNTIVTRLENVENVQVCSWTDLAAKSQNQPEGSQEEKNPLVHLERKKL